MATPWIVREGGASEQDAQEAGQAAVAGRQAHHEDDPGYQEWLARLHSFESLVDALRTWASLKPDALAYCYLSNGEETGRLTFAELDLRARAVGALLQKAGAKGERVLLFDTAGLDFIACYFGCLYAGSIAVPAYPPRHNRNTSRLEAIITDAEPRVVFTDSETHRRLSAWLKGHPGLEKVRWCLTDDINLEDAEGWVDPDATRQTLAFLQYTSGSTSTPKGVMVSHGNLLHNEDSLRAHFLHRPDTVMVSWLPLHHDLGLIGMVLGAMYNGVPCYLLHPVEFIKRPIRWLETISRYRGTFTAAPNFAFALCADRVAEQDRERLDLRSWVSALNGAEPVRAETLRAFTEAFGPCGFTMDCFFPGYGLAEHTLYACADQISEPVVFSRADLEQGRARAIGHGADRGAGSEGGDDGGHAAEQGTELVGCGRIPAERAVVIVNPVTCEECEHGVVGEIWLAGPSVAQGYWNRPDATQETFRARIRSTGEGPFLRTGDLGFIHSNELFIAGRSKDLIIIRGRNFYPQDIEATTEGCSEDLNPSFSAAFSFEAGGRENLVVVVEVRRQARQRVDVEALLDKIRREITQEYEILPAAVSLLPPRSVPKTTSGKIRRSEVRRMFFAGELEPIGEWRDQEVFDSLDAEQAEVGVDCTQEELEAWLLEQLSFRLKLPVERIDVGRSAAYHGLDSMAAADLAGKLLESFGIDLDLDDLFVEDPSLSVAFENLWKTLQQRLGRAEVEVKPLLEPAESTDGSDGGAVDEEALENDAIGVIRRDHLREVRQPSAMPISSLEGADPADPDALPEGWHPFRAFVNPELGRTLAQLSMDHVFVRGEGCRLWDEEGRQYLDFLAQYGALPFGFNPARVWDALSDVQWRKEPSFVQPSALGPASELARRLLAVAPPGMAYVTFTNSGAESVEAAIKLCRAATGRNHVLSAANGFHGKTMGALSATDRKKYQRPFGAPLDGFHYAPLDDIAVLRRALRTRRYAAFFVEPIQGEGGIVEPPPGFLAEAQEACRETGTLLVLDEIQTGLGRTGAMFAAEHDGLEPDVITVAKALGGGLMPIGACLIRASAYTADFGEYHTSTFAGNALACRAGLATLDLLEENDRSLIRHVAEIGARLKRRLIALKKRYEPIIEEVRGRGLLLGIKFGLTRLTTDRRFIGYLGETDALTGVVVSHLLNAERIRVGYALNKASVMRIEPPLTVSWDECEVFLESFERVLRRLRAEDLGVLSAHVTGYTVSHDPGAGAEGSGSGSGDSAGSIAVTAARSVEPQIEAVDGRFAVLVHPLNVEDYGRFDPSLKELTPEQQERIAISFRDNFDPFVIGETTIRSKTGRTAYGEFIVLPAPAAHLKQMPLEAAFEDIRFAASLARDRGARMIGLGAYTSVLSRGGLMLRGDGMPPLTTGNSFTAAASKQAVVEAARERGWDLGNRTAVVIGAGGSIGRALALLMAGQVGRLILIGNPERPEESKRRLLHVVGEIPLWIEGMAVSGRAVADTEITRAARECLQSSGQGDTAVGAADGEQLVARCPAIEVGVDSSGWLPDADIVLTATSSVDPIVRADLLKAGSIVCDVSRPSNVERDVRLARDDVEVFVGGIVEMPSNGSLGFNASLKPGHAYACMVEAMLLALEQQYVDTGLGLNLGLKTILELEGLAEKHGFVPLIETTLAD